jgi:hypothetical protein
VVSDHHFILVLVGICIMQIDMSVARMKVQGEGSSRSLLSQGSHLGEVEGGTGTWRAMILVSTLKHVLPALSPMFKQ